MLVVLTACDRDPFALRAVPEADEYCLAAQEVVTREPPARAAYRQMLIDCGISEGLW